MRVESKIGLKDYPSFFGKHGRTKALVLIGGLLVLMLLPLRLDQYIIHVLTMSIFFGYMGIAWNIFSGYSGWFSMGHSVFFGIGGYASTLLYIRLGMNPWVAMFAGAICTGIIAAVTGGFIFRINRQFFPIVTIAFLNVVKLLATYFSDFTRGSQGISLPIREGFRYLTMSNKVGYFYIIIVMVAIGIAISYKIRYSKLGLDLLALRDDEDAAEALGVATYSAKIKALSISAALLSMAGTFFAHYTLFVDPVTMFGTSFSFQMPIMSILGGIGTPIGPIIGSIITVPIDSVLRANLSGRLGGLNLLIFGLLLMIAVTFFPDGIISLYRRKKSKGAVESQRESESINARLEGADINSSSTMDSAQERHVDFGRDNEYASDQTEGKNILKVENLTVQFGGLTAVKNVNVCINEGEILGLIGPNGAGKTTCFNAITGYVMKSRTAGKVTFLGEEIKSGTSPHQLTKLGMTRTFQIVKPFSKMTVLENVMVATMMYEKNYRKARQDAFTFLERCRLGAYAEAHPGSLTIANQKRLELARALATRPKLLMLDEPMAGLNPSELDEMVDILREIASQGVTMVIIEHNMKAIMSLCDRVVVLDHGEKIAEGIPSEVSNNERVIEAYLGERQDAYA